MNHGILSSRALTAYGAFFCAFALFGPDFPLWGAPSYMWALLAGFLLVMAGLGMAIVLGLQANRRASWWAASSDDDQERRSSHGTMDTLRADCQLYTDVGGRTGPLVNLDGTPMLDDFIDVAGKVYGDSGTSLNPDLGAGMSDGGFSSGIDTHHDVGADW